MDRQIYKIKIDYDYLYIPVKIDGMLEWMDILNEDESEKLFEFNLPIDPLALGIYERDFYAEIPVRHLKGQTVTVKVNAPENFFSAIVLSDQRMNQREEHGEHRPAVHLTADSGWTNDPNGLIYKNGTYHFYFQYNPFNINWANMSWGHAISKDLLHWEQLDSVMFPDKDGTIFSGCAITNDRGLLGLPKDAMLFFYTAAGGTNEWSRGKQFVQKIAYSLDGGQTLVRLPDPCIDVIASESRDPKVFWHEPSGAYVMVLFIDRNDFAILRSNDLMHWDETDRFTLPEAWECPDFFELKSEDGESCWCFITADGFYYVGEFNGYRFKSDLVRHYTYVTKLPYAAQSYSDTEGRRVLVPWLRMPNDGRIFTSCYGIPLELTCRRTKNGFMMVQHPVREFMDQLQMVGSYTGEKDQKFMMPVCRDGKASVLKLEITPQGNEPFILDLNGARIQYSPESGAISFNNDKYLVEAGYKNFMFIIDDTILELFLGDGDQGMTFCLPKHAAVVQIDGRLLKECIVFEIK